VLTKLRQGKPVPGFTDVYFCPILVNDLAEIILEMVDSDLSGIYHVVGSRRSANMSLPGVWRRSLDSILPRSNQPKLQMHNSAHGVRVTLR
jgi:dTDP-4-dehydrorhamnose reductase